MYIFVASAFSKLKLVKPYIKQIDTINMPSLTRNAYIRIYKYTEGTHCLQNNKRNVFSAPEISLDCGLCLHTTVVARYQVEKLTSWYQQDAARKVLTELWTRFQ